MSILFAFIAYCGECQVHNRFAGWLNSSNSIKLGKKFTWQVDLSLRSSDQWKYIQTVVLRTGFGYRFNNTLSVFLAYANFHYQINMGEVSGYANDYQVWQQLFIRHRSFNRLNTTHRVTLEERFVAKPVLENNSIKTSDHASLFLFRYLLRNVFPFSNQKTFGKGSYAYAQQEIFLNVANNAASNGKTYSQFRALQGLGYRFSPKWDMEMGYLFRDIATKTSAHFHDHIIQLTSFIRL